ncbi:hypothetical protein V6N13_074020 [Hibiscus sabdariffa]|uniref:Uncharacterized protein n=1 Tax=Hibiscus sabdariffa TaxID=183260 RepID=A0ABR2U814_9ROSI
MESESERFDVVCCETDLEQPRSSPVVFGWPSVISLEAVGEQSKPAILELEWNSQQDKQFEFQISNLDSGMAKDNALSTSLTYTEDDLVQVPIKVVKDVSEQGVELVFMEWYV